MLKRQRPPQARRHWRGRTAACHLPQVLACRACLETMGACSAISRFARSTVADIPAGNERGPVSFKPIGRGAPRSSGESDCIQRFPSPSSLEYCQSAISMPAGWFSDCCMDPVCVPWTDWQACRCLPISQTAGLVLHGEDDQIVPISMSKAGSMSTDPFLVIETRWR